MGVSDSEILVVDDSLSIRKMVQYVLQSKGYHTTTAVDGQEALEKLAKHRYQLIVLDINMPRLDGFALLERLKADSDLSGIPVIMLTTEDRASDMEKARNLGASDYLIKPFKSSDLVEHVRKELTKH